MVCLTDFINRTFYKRQEFIVHTRSIIGRFQVVNPMIPESITYKNKKYHKSRKGTNSIKLIPSLYSTYFLVCADISKPLIQIFNIPVDYRSPGSLLWTILHVQSSKAFLLIVYVFFLRSIKNTQTKINLPSG